MKWGSEQLGDHEIGLAISRTAIRVERLPGHAVKDDIVIDHTPYDLVKNDPCARSSTSTFSRCRRDTGHCVRCAWGQVRPYAPGLP